MTPAEAIKYMERNTHTLIGEAQLKEIADAFGAKVDAQVYQNEPSNPKGLHTHGRVSEVKGLPCFVLAPTICNALGLEYLQLVGRGFQVRACCEALRHWVVQQEMEQK